VVAANLRPSLTSVGPLLEAIRAELRLSATAAGLLSSLPLLMFAAFAPFARFGRHVGTERMVLIGLVALATGTVLRSAAGTVALFAGTTLLAAGIAVTNILVPVLVKRHYPDRVPTLTTAYATVMGGCAALASGIAVPLAQVLPGGWRGSLAAWSALTVVAIVLWLPQLRPPHVPRTGETAPAGARPPWRSPIAWSIAGYMGVQSTMFFVAISWYPAYLREEGFTATAAGWLLSLYQVAALLAGMTVPLLVRRFHDQRGLAFTLASLSALSTLGLLLAPDAALAWMVLLGVGAGPSLILALSFMGLRAGSAQTAAALSLMGQGVGYAIAAMGPLAFGFVHDHTGGWTIALLCMISVALVKGGFGLIAGRRVIVD
jgi:CP family cyanate transporter-like MFS transporter